jgi:hypothetical protein
MYKQLITLKDNSNFCLHFHFAFLTYLTLLKLIVGDNGTLGLLGLEVKNNFYFDTSTPHLP